MKVCIHQPQYLPYCGFFHKLSLSDTFVLLDDVQFIDRGFIHRNKIKVPEGGDWITIPLIYNKRDLINKIKINNNLSWSEKHLKAIKRNYGKARYFQKYFSSLESIYNKKWNLLVDFDKELILYIIKELGIKIRIIKSSSLNVEGVGTDRLINICKVIGADTYISGPGGKKYMDEKKFEKEKIKLIYQNFQHPVYEQRFDKKFIPNLSIIDLLFNYGDKSLEIIKGK